MSILGKRDEFQILERRQLETAGFFYISHKNKVQQTHLKCLKKSIKSASKNSQEINLDKLVGMLQEDVSGSKNKANGRDSFLEFKFKKFFDEAPS